MTGHSDRTRIASPKTGESSATDTNESGTHDHQRSFNNERIN
ncbi:hypothetical protein SAMN04515672_3286 [Natronorubrum texcoconense]|uniref:Uncharacterized protein n=1 Tax=Natronorubrum texcoconense TaxID=1095776 RepID=A0A1G9CRJ3_9EURY|nr:hypothetical protein SAMN04515672_3286 [Natronorubrum texcoconense]